MLSGGPLQKRIFRESAVKCLCLIYLDISTLQKQMLDGYPHTTSHTPWSSVAFKQMNKVKEFVTKRVPAFLNNVGRVIGKRSVDGNPCSPGQQEEDMKKVQQLKEDLAQACPTFGIDPNAGLTAKAVQYAFDVSDEDDSAALDADELRLFENIMDTYEQCVLMEKAKRK